MRVSFGEFSFDSDLRELTVRDLPVHLSPKAFQLLAFLIEHRPRAVAKEDLYAHLWPATFVEEANLKNLVAEIRAALGDDPRAPRFVKTLYAHGYAFIAGTAKLDRTSPLPEKASWFLQHYSRTLVLGEGENVVGRDPACAAVIDEADVSRYHARIVIAGDAVTIEDLASKNGTFVNGARIREKTALTPGSEIGLGATVLWFRRRDALQSTKSASFAGRT